MKRAHRSEEFWREVVAGADASGLTRAKYAEQMGIGRAALGYWIHKVGGKAVGRRSQASRALVPVRLVASRDTSGGSLSMSCGGVVVRFEEGASIDYIAKLAAALRAC
jgi:hypothetical protein